MATIEAQIAHIWRRLGFGATRSELDTGVAAGPAATISELLGRPMSVPTAAQPNPYGWPAGTDWQAVGQAHARQLELMAFGPTTPGSGITAANYNPVQERLAWTFQGLLVVATIDSVYFADMVDHITLLRRSMTGTYRTLLTNVSTRPGMLKYLTGYLNSVGHPNENYARELMELFAIGRTNLRTGAVNYGQADVREIARALTGWQYDWTTGKTRFAASQWDPGPKTFLGKARGPAKLADVIAALAAHPSWRFHVPARLYRELTGLAPTPAVLDALNPVWGTAGNIRAVTSAIARRPEFLSDQAIFARVKSPTELLVSAARLLGWPITAYDGNLAWSMGLMGQHSFQAPNVGGWFKGDQWLNTNTMIRWSDVAGWMTHRGLAWDGSIQSTINPGVQQVHSNSSAATAPGYVLHLAGLDNASPNTLAKLTDYASSGPWTPGRAAGLLYLLVMSPEFLCC